MARNHATTLGLALVSALMLTAAAPAAAPAPTPAPAAAAAPAAPPTSMPAGADGSPATTDIRTIQDWTVRCFVVQSAAPCDIYQTAIQNETQKRVLGLSIAYAPREDSYVAQFVVPFGVALKNGVALEAGTYSVQNLQYRRCSAVGCHVEGKLDNAVIQGLSTAGEAGKVKIVSYDGQEIELPMSLKGFNDALAAMRTLARSKVAAQ